MYCIQARYFTDYSPAYLLTYDNTPSTG